MTTVLLVLVIGFGVIIFIQLGALVEMYGQVQQIRAHLDMFDRSAPLELGAAEGRSASSIGLPHEVDDADTALILFLSNRCETCFQIASALQGGVLPPRLWLVIVAVSGDADEFVDRFALRGERIIVDNDEKITGRLGLNVTPSAVRIEQGRLRSASTVPTVRRLYSLLPTPSYKRSLNVQAAASGGGD